MKYCRFCGAELRNEAVICPKCGCPTSAYKPHNVSSTGLLISFAVSLLVCFGAVVWGIFGDTSSAVLYSLTGSTFFNLLLIVFAFSASLYLLMNFSINDRKALIAFIFLGAILLVGFCVAAKMLSQYVEAFGNINKSSSSRENIKTASRILSISSITMVAYLVSAVLSILVGAFGLAGRFAPKQIVPNDKQPIEVEEKEEA